MASLRFLYSIFILIHIKSNVINCLTQNQSDLIDSAINLFQTSNHIPGIALAVVQDGETVIAKGYGKRNIEANLDVDNNTLFAIGSITKVKLQAQVYIWNTVTRASNWGVDFFKLIHKIIHFLRV